MGESQRKDQFAKTVNHLGHLFSEECKRVSNLQGHLNAEQDKTFTLKADNERLRKLPEKMLSKLEADLEHFKSKAKPSQGRDLLELFYIHNIEWLKAAVR